MKTGKTKFAVAVVSKGRAWTSSTLRHLQNIPPDIPVYVYTDRRECDAYSKMWPGYIVIPHNETKIIKIRGFVQDHQYSLGYNTLMLDDDIEHISYSEPENVNSFWDVSMTDMVLRFRDMLNTCDFVHTHHHWSVNYYRALVNPEYGTHVTKNYTVCAVALIGFTPKLKDLGISYSAHDYFSEDLYITIETLIAQERGLIKVGYLPLLVKCDYDGSKSHFNALFHYNACVEMYILYGTILELYINHHGDCWGVINKAGVELYVKHGVIYRRDYDEKLSAIRKYKFAGHKIIEKYNWKPETDYKTEALEELDRRTPYEKYLEWINKHDYFCDGVESEFKKKKDEKMDNFEIFYDGVSGEGDAGVTKSYAGVKYVL